MRRNAANWIELAGRVWHLRRDAIAEDELRELGVRREELRLQLAGRADAGKLRLGIEALEGVLRRTGGAAYPRSFLVENIEFCIMAAFVILGIRTYFVQPFKIPTNSMWPTYHGMKGELIPPSAPARGPFGRAFRYLALGAEQREVVAPRAGELSAPFFAGTLQLAYTLGQRRNWFGIQDQVREYALYVDGVPATVEVPADFADFDELFVSAFFPGRETLLGRIRKAASDDAADDLYQRREEGSDEMARVRRVPLGRTVRSGDPLLRFEILTGDQLFVDRISYHFVRPSAGQGFVFRTGRIRGISQDQYFIKRLIGSPGDRIEIREPGILRNGAPITGSEAFDLNARRAGHYRGYFNATREDGRFTQLFKDQVVTVPANSYLALGDNSRDSLDGRFWGFVPAKDVVGPPICIYYPFSGRWGMAR